MNQILLALFIIPAVFGLLILAIPARIRHLHGILSILVTAVVTFLALKLWGNTLNPIFAWAGPGLEFNLRLYPFSQFIVAAVAGFSLLISLYALKFMDDRKANNQFFGFLLISEAMAIGAVLANNLVVMLFFWEGLLITLFALINIGKEQAFRVALKAFVIVGLSDLCLMLGIGITGIQAKTFVMTEIQKAPLNTIGLNGVAFVLMLIGAMAKAGAMPFHTWIPDAADAAPLPFMAFLPAALEKLMGIYLVTRICLDLFVMDPGMKIFVMTVGAVTILLAVAMALIQKDFKRLLSYHAISQVGYMILGIGTGVPIGIVGGLFHMINHAMYKCCLFLSGGAVEKQTGTTDLRKLGGLGRQMPITFTCFFVAAASISGFYFTNGFVSKELIFDGTLETGYIIFFIAAALGAVLTAASFLKLGHAAFFGKTTHETKKVSEASWIMLTPMVILAAGCLFFGTYFPVPLNYLIKPSLALSLGEKVREVNFGYHLNSWLFWLTLGIVLIAILNHWIGVKLSGKGLGASEHIHHAPVLKNIYDWAEKRAFDPYNWGSKIGSVAAQGFYLIDRGVDWVYQQAVPGVASVISDARRVHNGKYANYLSWALVGMIIVVLYFTL